MSERVIQNYAALASTPARANALSILEAGLTAIDTAHVIEHAVVVTNGVLSIRGHEFTLAEYEHVYIIGFGKLVCAAAAKLEELLESHLDDGAVIGIEEEGRCSVVTTYAGAHPKPTHFNYTASKHIQEIAARATARDLVLVIVSGGGSSLLCGSYGECEQGAALYDAFKDSGGTIEELNVLRKHLSTLKGGGLAATLQPATVVGLIFSDVPGGDLAAVASGPTFYDESTVADAAALATRYKLGEFHFRETPKDKAVFENVTNIPLVDNTTALTAMQAEAAARGYDAHILTQDQYLTPEDTITLLRRHDTHHTALLMGGETRLEVPPDCAGKGGRNAALGLSFYPQLRDGEVFIAAASDGQDNSDAAGVIVDQETRAAALAAGLSAEVHQRCFDSYPFFEATESLIKTGPLPSNVADLMLLLTPDDTSYL